ncbi:hypothetical protein B0H34DRAFT_707299 [Crassisporium funariophilum]|nr:hypothetical protein B0H34DRAFT_707299 [Crassisporium funariophilum]
MIAVPSDEPEGSSQSTIISTRYCLPPQASAYSTSTTVFSVPTEHHLPTTVVHPVDDPLLWNNKPAANFSSLDIDPTLDPAYVAEVEAERVTAKRSRIRTNQLKRWLPDRDLYLADFLRLEGRGDHPDVCPRHRHTGKLHHASYCCIDCSGGELLCQGCMVSTHMYNPLHQIEVGHPFDNSCPIPHSVNDFVVVHTNGVHKVAVDFCSCQQAKPHILQLLCY